MGVGYVRNDTSNNIADGKTIDAADFDGEFDAIVAAFDETTGHTHDGTAAEGAAITTFGPAQEYLGDGTSFNPKTDDTYDLGTAALQWKDLYLDGTANIDVGSIDALTVTATATFSGATIADLGTVTTADIDGGTVDGVTLGTNSAITELQVDNININGNSITSTDAAGDINLTPHTTGDVVIDGLKWPQADGTVGQLMSTNGSGQLSWASATTVDFTSIDSDVEPDTDNTYDLGAVGAEWKDLYIDGVAYIDSLEADTADINAGTIDNAVIGGSTAVAGTFTTLTATGDTVLGNAATDTVTVTADVASDLIPSADNTYDLGAVGSEWKDLFIDGTANLDTVDINAGAIDGTTIGASSAAAGTFTTLTSTGNTVLGDAGSDTVTVNADVASDLVPSADNTYDLGAVGSEWKDLFIDGTANIDSLVANTADINGGTVDGATIGGSSAGAGTFSTLTSTGEIVEATGTMPAGTTPAINPTNGTVQEWTLSGNSTPTDSLADGEFVELHIDDGTAYTITWTSVVDEWIGGSAPTLDTAETTVIVLQKIGSNVIGRFIGYAS